MDNNRNEYLRRIYKVQDFIEKDLSRDLSLEQLAEVAGFSKYHFHRIFKGIMNESLLQYTNRTRIEKAAYTVIYRQDVSITDIAYQYGYVNSSAFSRAFKDYYNLTPSQYRDKYSKNCKDTPKISSYNRLNNNSEFKKNTNNINVDVEILTIKKMYVIYARHMGTYLDLANDFPKLLQNLYNYSKNNNLPSYNEAKLFTAYHHNPEITDEQNLITSLCMTVPLEIEVTDGEGIGSMIIQSGKYAVGHFDILKEQYPLAWDFLYSEWFPASGYKPSDTFPFEMYINNPNDHPENRNLVDIYLPIECI